jgi:hypothetical protein
MHQYEIHGRSSGEFVLTLVVMFLQGQNSDVQLSRGLHKGLSSLKFTLFRSARNRSLRLLESYFRCFPKLSKKTESNFFCQDCPITSVAQLSS